MNAEDLFLQLWARIVHDEDEAVPGLARVGEESQGHSRAVRVGWRCNFGTHRYRGEPLTCLDCFAVLSGGSR